MVFWERTQEKLLKVASQMNEEDAGCLAWIIGILGVVAVIWWDIPRSVWSTVCLIIITVGVVV